MFNKLIAIVATVLVVPATLTQGAAIQARNADLSPNAQVCTGPLTGCITIPISSDDCTSFTGGLSFLNKEVTEAVIPDGFVCTFFEQFGCLSEQGGEDTVNLQGGTWSFFSVPGPAGTVDFNDLSSSFQCTVV
ncbi:hypothetical protein CVT26_000763 [Gymnopilus dilepis]|uniref:Uncharacterized protein n=1 Tax=Gymnopilus dilepis TaxID=231916 RepID=A0A409Y2J2_9AGAR|nr:hypothetical protein CVT26_000763 [Gymnopilus dilepis]